MLIQHEVQEYATVGTAEILRPAALAVTFSLPSYLSNFF